MSSSHVRSCGIRGLSSAIGRLARCVMAGESCLSAGRIAICAGVKNWDMLFIIAMRSLGSFGYGRTF